MDAVELGRRVRAARAYAGFSAVEDLGEQVGVGRSTLLKIEHGERLPKKWELWAIAEVCGVPRSFFTDEWAGGISAADLSAAEEAAGPAEDEPDAGAGRAAGQSR